MITIDFKENQNSINAFNESSIRLINCGDEYDILHVEMYNETTHSPKKYMSVQNNQITVSIPPLLKNTNFSMRVTNINSEIDKRFLISCQKPKPRMMMFAAAPMAVEEKRYLTIDPESRKITMPPEENFLGVFSDRNIERKWFKCPKIVGDEKVDLTTCEIFINYVSTGNKPGQYHCTDISDLGGEIEFSWLLSGNVFDSNKKGNVYFAVQAKTAKGVNVFNTTKAVGLVDETVEAIDYTEEQYADTIPELISRIENLEKNGGGSSTPGKDGYSPEAKVVKSGNTATITITDKNGTTTATITDGAPGTPGGKGDKGDTPVKGVDYYTVEEKNQLVQDVLTELPKWVGGEY